MALLALVGVIVTWHLLPMVMVLCLKAVPLRHRLAACRSFAGTAVTSLALLPVVLLSPVAVPIALLFTPREANALPGWAQWWDNDVSINGDWPQYWPLDYEGTTYYADAHPRSFKARFVWLVLRNRASWLADHLGHVYAPGENADREHWGDPDTSRSHEGWVLNRCARVYQFYRCQKLGSLCLRTNYGYKIWTEPDPTPRGMVIAITASLLGWQGL